MIDRLVHDVGNISAGTTIGGGVFLFFGENATAIGAMTVVFTAMVTLIFQYLNYSVNKRHKDIDRRKARAEILAEMEEVIAEMDAEDAQQEVICLHSVKSQKRTGSE